MWQQQVLSLQKTVAEINCSTDQEGGKKTSFSGLKCHEKKGGKRFDVYQLKLRGFRVSADGEAAASLRSLKLTSQVKSVTTTRCHNLARSKRLELIR